METALLTIAAILAVAVIVSLAMAFFTHKGKNPSRNKEDPPLSPPSVVVSRGVVTVRSAGSTVEVMMQGPEPVLGPLSDMSLDLNAWDSLRRKDLSDAQRRRYVEILHAQGFNRTYETKATNGDSSGKEVEKVSGIDEEFFSNLSYDSTDDGPDGDLVYEALTDEDIHKIMELIKDYMASGRSTPAFAREIAEVYNFSLKFSDPKKEEASHDRTLLAEAEKFRDEIRKSVPEAFEKYYMYMESKGTVPVEEKQKKKTEEVQNQPAKGKRLVVDGLDWSSLRKHRK